MLSKPTKLTEVVSDLEEKTSDEIAQLFLDLGIKGDKYQSCRCPVAYYLANKMDHDPYNLAVGSDRIEVWDTIEGFLQNKQDFFLKEPSSVRSFIIKFDNGGYPELES